MSRTAEPDRQGLFTNIAVAFRTSGTAVAMGTLGLTVIVNVALMVGLAENVGLTEKVGLIEGLGVAVGLNVNVGVMVGEAEGHCAACHMALSNGC